jgi:protein-L-isoaspartate(D-aspartate) O-methyltransferase
MPLWLRPGVQVSVAFARGEERLRSTSVFGCGFMRLRGPHAGPDTHVVVPGWSDRAPGATPEREWTAALEDARPERVAQLRALLAGPAESIPVPLPSAGWTTRFALDEREVIAFSGRETWWHFACGLFAPERDSLALFDAGMVVSFGDRSCADRLVDRLPTLAPLQVHDLDIKAVPHPAGDFPDAWVLERAGFDLVVREPKL